MRQADEHCEISADDACQGGGAGPSPFAIWVFALAMVLVAAIAFVLIAAYAQS